MDIYIQRLPVIGGSPLSHEEMWEFDMEPDLHGEHNVPLGHRISFMGIDVMIVKGGALVSYRGEFFGVHADRYGEIFIAV